MPIRGDGISSIGMQTYLFGFLGSEIGESPTETGDGGRATGVEVGRVGLLSPSMERGEEGCSTEGPEDATTGLACCGRGFLRS